MRADRSLEDALALQRAYKQEKPMKRILSILLQSGGLWDFEHPFESKFTIEDIAHNLSNICRFNGGCDVFYSVAQHSVGVHQLVLPELRKAALVHDAAEFVYGDMTTWLKSLCPDYRALLEEGEKAVADGLGVPRGMHPDIKRADWLMLAVERRHLFKNTVLAKGEDGFHHLDNISEADIDSAELLVDVTPWSPRYARDRFLEAWKEVLAEEIEAQRARRQHQGA